MIALQLLDVMLLLLRFTTWLIIKNNLVNIFPLSKKYVTVVIIYLLFINCDKLLLVLYLNCKIHQL